MFIGFNLHVAASNKRKGQILKDQALPALSQMKFLKNEGQWNSNILYQLGSQLGDIRFLQDGISYAKVKRSGNFEFGPQKDTIPRGEILVWNTRFLNTQSNKKILEVNAQPSKINYLKGFQKDQNFLRVSECNKIVYQNIYPHTDIEYYTQDNHLKYDIIIQPQGDVTQIALKFEGVKDLQLTQEGSLIVNNGWDSYEELKPYSYQVINGVRHEVEVKYTIREDHILGFEVKGEIQPNIELVIDPLVVTYCTYFRLNHGAVYDCDLDANGNIYMTGFVVGNMPTTPGVYQLQNNGDADVCVIQLNQNGTGLNYATFIGGTGWESGYAITMDKQNAYIVGLTQSSNYPNHGAILASYQSLYTGFLTCLDASGSNLLSSTYVGGLQDTYLGHATFVYDVKVNPQSKEIYIAGVTTSISMPMLGSFQQTYPGLNAGFIWKLNPAANGIINSTYLGVSTLFDQLYSLAIDNQSNVYVCGETSGGILPQCVNVYTGGNTDGFVAKLSPNLGSLLYYRFIGGTDSDVCLDLAVNDQQEVFLCGDTRSNDFPLNPNIPVSGFSNGLTWGFAVRLNNNASSLIYSRYIGSGLSPNFQRAHAHSIGIYQSDQAIIAGHTDDIFFPVSANALVPNPIGGMDYFVEHLDGLGNNSTCGGATYWGGKLDELSIPKISVSKSAIQQFFVLCGNTISDNVPTTANAYEPNKINAPNFGQAFATRFEFTTPVVSFSGLPATVCQSGQSVQLTGSPAGGVFSGNGMIGNIFHPSLAQPSTNLITYTYTNSSGCTGSSVQSVVVQSSTAIQITGLPNKICKPQSVSLLGFPAGGVFSGNGVNGNTLNSASLIPGTHVVTYTYTHSSGCISSVSQQVQIVAPPSITASTNNLNICRSGANNTAQLSANGGLSYSWSPTGSLNASNISSPVASPSVNTTYTVIGTDINGCTNTASVSIQVQPPLFSLGPDFSVYANSSFVLSPNPVPVGAYTYNWYRVNGTQLIPLGNTASLSLTANWPIINPLRTFRLCINYNGPSFNCQTCDDIIVRNDKVNPNLAIFGSSPGELNFEIYPIPIQKNMTIKLNQVVEDEVMVQIWDQAGRLLKSQLYESIFADVIHTELNLAPGIYLVSLRTNKQHSRPQKILIQ